MTVLSWSSPLVDHHCHALVLDRLDRAAFEGLMNEGRGGPAAGRSAFDSMLGLALRRWCAPVLDLPPLVDADRYLARRAELGVEASRRLVAAAGLDTLLIDDGLPDPRLAAPEAVAGLAGARWHRVLRLEREVETLLQQGVDPDAVPAALGRVLDASGAVATKSIAAYRTGLDLPDRPPERPAVVAALRRLGNAGRLADPVLSGWLAWTALEWGRPLQLHVGYGDADLDLSLADPLRLTPFLRATEPRGVPVMLLHCYPFHRSAAYLAQVFDHVHVDVGLAVHNSGALSVAVLREVLELAPFGTLLFSTDAYGLAEHYLLGTTLFRRGLDTVLGGLVASGDVDDAEAHRIARLITVDNARRVYRLPEPGASPPAAGLR